MTFKKIALSLLALPLLLTLSAPSQAALEGDTCMSHSQANSAVYRCANIQKGQALTVYELYQLGYRVVSAYPYKTGHTIIIEKQTS